MGKRVIRSRSVAAIVLLGAWCVSCSSSSRSLFPLHLPGQGDRREDWYKDILQSPKRIREDYVYPPSRTQQSFSWGKNHSEWRINFPTKGYAYAGIFLRRPVDLSRERAVFHMSFQIKPARAAEALTIGLVDGNKTPARVMVLTPPVKKMGTSERWTEYSIHLKDFDDSGVSLDATPENAEQLLPFDWSDIQEIRIISGGGLSRKEIVIRKLGFHK